MIKKSRRNGENQEKIDFEREREGEWERERERKGRRK